MKKFLLGLSFIVFFSCKSVAQDYKTHKVKEGETIESIAQKYLVTPYDIYALNPDAKTNFGTNTVLIIPKSKVTEAPESTVEEFKTHKVKRKETLYSISKKYNVSIDDIKKYNKRLYSENLRKGDKIKIPLFDTSKPAEVLTNTIKKYTVLPKEGKWRVAYKFGITIDELNTLNPGIGEVLQEGQEINVPNVSDNEEKQIDETYGYYAVLPKEGFFRLKVKLGLEQEQLEALNPELKESGLKEGMVLKIPIDAQGEDVVVADSDKLTIKDKLTNFDTKRIAVMLPFRLHRVDLDSVSEAKETIQKDPYISLSLDFHSGLLMALDSAKQLGISTKLDVYDTKVRPTEVSKLISDNDFSQYDAVIGPITAETFDRAASLLRSKNVPVVSPLTKPTQLYKNVYQTIPSVERLRAKMINFVKEDTIPSQIIIVTDAKSKSVSDELVAAFPKATRIFSRRNDKGVDQYYILKDDIESKLVKGKNIVFLETSNEGFVSNVTSILNAFNGKTIYEEKNTSVEREIVLMTTNKNKAFEGRDISGSVLSKLQFHYPSTNKTYNPENFNSFVSKYEDMYNTKPNKYAIRGFDLTMDILLRLAYEKDLYDASTSEIETEYTENKFRYAKKVFGGYYNEASYIMKYEDLQIIEVKTW